MIMAIQRNLTLVCISMGLLIVGGCSESQQTTTAGGEVAATELAEPDSAEVAELRLQLASLKIKAQKVKDANAIKRLQRAYGYYMDEALWDDVADLFSADATIEIAREGVYQGQERIRAYLYQLGGGQSGLQEGQLNEQFQLMPVVTLAEDGLSAKGRWRAIIMAGEYGESANWGEGPYENEYIKEEGIWKISKLHWFQTIMVPFEGGWAVHADVNNGVYVSTEFPPDAPSTTSYGSWPETFLPPFHFPNPVATFVPADSAGGE